MTSSEVLLPAGLLILFVCAWFVFGVIDSTRDDARARRAVAGRAPSGHASTVRR